MTFIFAWIPFFTFIPMRFMALTSTWIHNPMIHLTASLAALTTATTVHIAP
ncbi:hypothetical protein [Romboutsia weinsteinii]|uniref:hypothetical protein n=1 Tax=Romboutsia weinsteinii TaxID=2020949 RepID=UPI00131485E5|nr:hypothetical protein [Romboutsia weinsteinii]